jgi:hypothetical protein
VPGFPRALLRPCLFRQPSACLRSISRWTRSENTESLRQNASLIPSLRTLCFVFCRSAICPQLAPARSGAMSRDCQASFQNRQVPLRRFFNGCRPEAAWIASPLLSHCCRFEHPIALSQFFSGTDVEAFAEGTRPSAAHPPVAPLPESPKTRLFHRFQLSRVQTSFSKTKLSRPWGCLRSGFISGSLYQNAV